MYIGSNTNLTLMTVFKLMCCITLFLLAGCQSNKHEVITKWNNGNTKVERIYSDPPHVYIEKEYYESGQLKHASRFIDSLKNGEDVGYYENGQLAGKAVYKNGKINGPVMELHKNGNVMFTGNQVDGKLNGTATHYYDNGKPETESFFKNDKSVIVNYWDSTGTQQIKNGEGIKKFQYYVSKNGNDATIPVLVVGAYKDSVATGIWKYYRLSDNKLILEREFKDDKVVSESWKQ